MILGGRMRVAIVHDYLTVFGGAERVLDQIITCFPDADLFSLIERVPEEQRAFLHGKAVKTSFLQKLPRVERYYRKLLPLMPFAIERFDLRGYDVVISSSYAVAKGVLTSDDQLHVVYLQARNLKYAYEDRWFYSGGPVRHFVEDFMLSPLRVWDGIASRRADVTIANSQFVRRWHKKMHGVDADVIYPPVDVSLFTKAFSRDKSDYYIVTARLEPYKRIDLVVEAFARMGRPLVVIGDGTEMARLRALAKDNIEFAGYCKSAEIAQRTAKARAFLFPSREDFGIAPLEAQACGTPVIALSRGAASETVRALDIAERPSGLYFHEQSVEAIIAAVEEFERRRGEIAPEDCRDNAARFAADRFRAEFRERVLQAYDQWRREHFPGAHPVIRGERRPPRAQS
jgi:glycosyltransferase involved in cell wall biosynthesis